MSETPAEHYKRIVAGIEAAAAEQRERDGARARRLEHSLALLDARMRKVGERTALARFSVDLHWESALEALWAEPWMTVRPFPRPDPTADPAHLDRYDREVHDTYEQLMSLIARPKFGFRR